MGDLTTLPVGAAGGGDGSAARSIGAATIEGAACDVWEYEPAKLHTKLVVIDDAVHIGSANFDIRSVFLNLEVMLRVEDRAFADGMRAYFAAEQARSTRITPELHRARGTLWTRITWALSRFVVATMDYNVSRRLNFGLTGR